MSSHGAVFFPSSAETALPHKAGTRQSLEALPMPPLPRGVRTKAELVDHVRTHTGSKCHKSQYCSRSYTYRYGLVAHTREHTGENTFHCEHCAKLFSIRSLFLLHLRTHTGERPFACNHCQQTFAQHSTLVHHLRRHTGEKPFHCDQCSKAFARKITLTIHKRQHTGKALPVRALPRSLYSPVEPCCPCMSTRCGAGHLVWLL